MGKYNMEKVRISLIEMVEEELKNMYCVSEAQSKEYINNSGFNDLLDSDLEFVAHHSPEYWAKIIKENNDSNYQ